MKDAYYFSHDSNAKDDPKCSMLIEQLGCEGYGIYWILVETLRDQPEFRYPLNMLPILARKYNTTHEKVKVVVGNYGLFVVEDSEFFSLSLCKRMAVLESKREKAREAGIKSGTVRALLTGTPIEEKHELPQVYVILCRRDKEEFVKIGSTLNTISRRYSGKLPYKYEIVWQLFTNTPNQLEEELHKAVKGFSYSPTICFAGVNECYSVDALDILAEYTPKEHFSHERRFNVASTSKVKKSKGKENKDMFAEFVTLTQEEHKKLIEKFGETIANDWIERLNLWKGSKGEKTASDYLTILNWARREEKEKPVSVKPDKGRIIC